MRTDRGTKKRVYARAGIPIYWIVNLIERQIEVYTEPSDPSETPDYAQRRAYGPTETLPVILNDVDVGRLPVHELLP